MEERLNAMFSRMRPFLNKRQRAYFEDKIAGRGNVDVEIELEMLLTQAQLLWNENANAKFQKGEITRELADMANAIRMTAKDLNDIRKSKADQEAKSQGTDKVALEDQAKEKERLELVLSRAKNAKINTGKELK